MHSELHTPVLFEEVQNIFLEKKFIQPTVVDATLWLWWHAEMLSKNMESGAFIGFDRDTENLARAKLHLEWISPKIHKNFIASSFENLERELTKIWIGWIDAILYDLWVSSVHYDDANRGFSLREDGPLDMRFDRTQGKTAEDLIMTLDVRELSHIFEEFWEEKKSWFIANAIVDIRKKVKIDTTKKLLDIIESSSFDKKSPIRVFQALRIAVNEEFVHIENSLLQALSLLKVRWIIMVITFHSLEDRLVKRLFAPYLEDSVDDFTWQIREKAHCG